MRLLILSVATALVTLGFSDTWRPPRPRVVSSPNGEYALKVIPPVGKVEGKAEAVLFTLDEKGNEKRLWKSTLVNIPYAAYVTDTGRVATLDTYARIGFQHALVVYGDKGHVLADYNLEELLTPDEIQQFPHTASSRWWSEGRTLTHRAEGDWSLQSVGGVGVNRSDSDTVAIGLKKGLNLIVDMVTGKVTRDRD